MPSLHGVWIPVITPLTATLRVDVPALKRLLRRLHEHGVTGILLMGTTGEGLSLSIGQRQRLIHRTAGLLAERLPLMVNISATGAADALFLARAAEIAGASACLVHLPPYYRLQAGEMEAYFRRMADASPLPVLLYNIPQNTQMSIPEAVVMRLAGHPNILGIKDSEPDEERQMRLIAFARERTDFVHLLGVARFARWGWEAGAHGGILAVGNLIPGACVELYRAVRAGDHARAEQLQALVDRASRLYAGGRTMGQGIAAMKVVLHALGLCHPLVLPPLRVPDAAEQARIREEMREVFPEGRDAPAF